MPLNLVSCSWLSCAQQLHHDLTCGYGVTATFTAKFPELTQAHSSADTIAAENLKAEVA